MVEQIWIKALCPDLVDVRCSVWADLLLNSTLLSLALSDWGNEAAAMQEQVTADWYWLPHKRNRSSPNNRYDPACMFLPPPVCACALCVRVCWRPWRMHKCRALASKCGFFCWRWSCRYENTWRWWSESPVFIYCEREHLVCPPPAAVTAAHLE